MDKYTIGSGAAVIACVLVAVVVYCGLPRITQETCTAARFHRAVKRARERPTPQARALARYGIERAYPKHLATDQVMDTIFEAQPYYRLQTVKKASPR